MMQVDSPQGLSIIEANWANNSLITIKLRNSFINESVGVENYWYGSFDFHADIIFIQSEKVNSVLKENSKKTGRLPLPAEAGSLRRQGIMTNKTKKQRYQIYRPCYLDVAKALKVEVKHDRSKCFEVFGKSWSKVSREELEEKALTTAVEMARLKEAQLGTAPEQPGIDGIVCMEEWHWNQSGRHVYFPLPGLLDRLYEAKIDIDPNAFELPHHTFTVAVPHGETVGGMEIPGFMVVFADRETKKELGRDFGNTLYGKPVEVQTGAGDDEGEALFLTYRQNEVYIARASTPLSRIEVLLQEAQDRPESEVIQEVLPAYDAPGIIQLSEEEAAIQFRMIKSVINLAVYMKACPDSVVDGYPEMINTGSLPIPNPRATAIGVQHFEPVSRSGPRSHWRRWHFRRYPIRKDGSRRPGVVHVEGAMVGPRQSPHTVKTVGDA